MAIERRHLAWIDLHGCNQKLYCFSSSNTGFAQDIRVFITVTLN